MASNEDLQLPLHGQAPLIILGWLLSPITDVFEASSIQRPALYTILVSQKPDTGPSADYPRSLSRPHPLNSYL